MTTDNDFNELGCRGVSVREAEVLAMSDVLESRDDDGDSTFDADCQIIIYLADGRKLTTRCNVEVYEEEQP